MIKGDSPIWLNALVLEIFSGYFNNEELLVTLYLNYDMSEGRDSESKVLHNVTNAIGQYVQYLTGDSIKPESTSSSTHKKVNRSFRVLEMLNNTEAPSLTILQMRTLCGETLINMVNSLYRLGEKEHLMDVLGAKYTGAGDNQRIKIFQSICSISWPSLLGALSTLIGVTNNLEKLEILFGGFRSFFVVCCVLELDTPRDAFMTAVTKATIPKNQDLDQINRRNVVAMKTLLYITKHYGNILTSGWKLTLQNVNSLASLITSPQLQQLVQMRELNANNSLNTSGGIKPSVKITTEELGTLVSTLDTLFDNCSYLRDEALLFLLEGLFELIKEKFIDVDPANVPKKCFAMEKLEELVMVNLHRAEIIWDDLFEQLKQSIQNSVIDIRTIGLDTFSRIVVAMFSHYSKQINEVSEGSGDISAEQTLETQIYIQNRLLEALEEASRSKYNDVRQKTLETLNQVLQSSGQSITKGWPLILSILMTIAVNHDKPHIVFGFNSVTLICTDFLSNLPLGKKY